MLASLLVLVGLLSIPAGADPSGAEYQIREDWTVDCGNDVFLDLQ